MGEEPKAACFVKLIAVCRPKIGEAVINVVAEKQKAICLSLKSEHRCLGVAEKQKAICPSPKGMGEEPKAACFVKLIAVCRPKIGEAVKNVVAEKQKAICPSLKREHRCWGLLKGRKLSARH